MSRPWYQTKSWFVASRQSHASKKRSLRQVPSPWFFGGGAFDLDRRYRWKSTSLPMLPSRSHSVGSWLDLSREAFAAVGNCRYSPMSIQQNEGGFTRTWWSVQKELMSLPWTKGWWTDICSELIHAYVYRYRYRYGYRYRYVNIHTYICIYIYNIYNIYIISNTAHHGKFAPSKYQPWSKHQGRWHPEWWSHCACRRKSPVSNSSWVFNWKSWAMPWMLYCPNSTFIHMYIYIYIYIYIYTIETIIIIFISLYICIYI